MRPTAILLHSRKIFFGGTATHGGAHQLNMHVDAFGVMGVTVQISPQVNDDCRININLGGSAPCGII